MSIDAGVNQIEATAFNWNPFRERHYCSLVLTGEVLTMPFTINQQLSALKLTHRVLVVLPWQQVNWVTVRQAGKAGTATHRKTLSVKVGLEKHQWHLEEQQAAVVRKGLVLRIQHAELAFPLNERKVVFFCEKPERLVSLRTTVLLSKLIRLSYMIH